MEHDDLVATLTKVLESLHRALGEHTQVRHPDEGLAGIAGLNRDLDLRHSVGRALSLIHI